MKINNEIRDELNRIVASAGYSTPAIESKNRIWQEFIKLTEPQQEPPKPDTSAEQIKKLEAEVSRAKAEITQQRKTINEQRAEIEKLKIKCGTLKHNINLKKDTSTLKIFAACKIVHELCLGDEATIKDTYERLCSIFIKYGMSEEEALDELRALTIAYKKTY